MVHHGQMYIDATCHYNCRTDPLPRAATFVTNHTRRCPRMERRFVPEGQSCPQASLHMKTMASKNDGFPRSCTSLESERYEHICVAMFIWDLQKDLSLMVHRGKLILTEGVATPPDPPPPFLGERQPPSPHVPPPANYEKLRPSNSPKEIATLPKQACMHRFSLNVNKID